MKAVRPGHQCLLSQSPGLLCLEGAGPGGHRPQAGAAPPSWPVWSECGGGRPAQLSRSAHLATGHTSIFWPCLSRRPGCGHGSQAPSLERKSQPCPVSTQRPSRAILRGARPSVQPARMFSSAPHANCWWGRGAGSEKSGLHTPAASNPDAFNRPHSRPCGAEAAARAVGGMQVPGYSCPWCTMCCANQLPDRTLGRKRRASQLKDPKIPLDSGYYKSGSLVLGNVRTRLPFAKFLMGP